MLAAQRAQVVHIPYEQAYGAGFEDIRMRVPDVSRLRRAIGFQPTMTLDEILQDVRDHLARP